MKLPALLVADQHLTAHPDDEYRWGLFPWLRDTIRDERIQTLNLLGDLTDAKDNHPAKLANRLVTEISETAKAVPVTRILMGNHDYLKRNEAFFSFLSHLPGVRYIDTPWDDGVETGEGPHVYYAPHTKEPHKDLTGDFTHFDYLFMHQTIKGAVASNGMGMPGWGEVKLNANKVYSGDIHVPQIINGVEYVGSPYHVHFGDNFTPRVVLIDKRGRPHDLHFDSPRRVMLKVTSLKELRAADLSAGDHVRVTISLDPAEAHEWAVTRRAAAKLLEDRGVFVRELRMAMSKSDRRVSTQASAQLSRMSSEAVMLRFVEREELGADALDIGLELLK